MKIEKEIDVVGIGVSVLDILHLVDRFPDKEDVQKSYESKIEGGGPVATAIVTLARLGAITYMIDGLGDDWIGKKILDDFEKENVNTDFIKINKNKSSSIASILVRRKDGARTIIYSPGSSPELNISEIPKDLIKRSKYIHINGRHNHASLHACRIAKETGTKISFDGGAHRFRNELKEIVPLADILIIARDFAEKYYSDENIESTAKKILRNGAEIVVITDGLNGSYLYTREIEGYHQKAFLLENIVDTTGCGDSYHGAFLFGLCNNYSLYDSIEFASAVAALNTRKLGGREALPILEKVIKFIKKRKNNN
mgnify:CR=1 FL=1